MSAPTVPPGLLCVHHLIDLLRRRENVLKADLVLKLHTDGSGRVQDNATDEDRLTFDNVGELASWLYSSADQPEPAANGTQRGRFFISNPCLGGFHSQCEDACHCRCHQPSEGIGA